MPKITDAIDTILTRAPVPELRAHSMADPSSEFPGPALYYNQPLGWLDNHETRSSLGQTVWPGQLPWVDGIASYIQSGDTFAVTMSVEIAITLRVIIYMNVGSVARRSIIEMRQTRAAVILAEGC
jgi:hypothetical protein